MESTTTKTLLRFNVLAATEKQPTVVLTLESTNTILTILVSLSILLGIGVQLIFRFIKINSDIKDLKDDFKNHANSEGHEKLAQQVRLLQQEAAIYDKQFAVHQSNYIARTETVNMLIGQLDEKINYRSKLLEEMVKETEMEIKDVQKYLQKREDFKIREIVK